MVECKGYTWEQVKDLHLGPCLHCQKGIMKARRAGVVTEHAWDTMEKLALDYKGPFPVLSYNHYNGFYLISDYASNFIMAYLVRSKKEIIECVKKFMADYVRAHNRLTLVLQCDFERVNTSSTMRAWLRSEHIRLQTSPPYEHNRNGQIERDMGTVLDKARTMMAEYNVPQRFWEYAVVTACYLINRSPTRSRPVTPLELVTGIKPDITNLYPFYCPGVYHLTREERQGQS